MKRKKAAAVLCALAVVFTSSGGLPFGGLRLFDTAVTAYAATAYSSGRVRISDVAVNDIISKNCQLYKNNGHALEIYDTDGTTLLQSYQSNGFIKNVQPGYNTIVIQSGSGAGSTVKIKKLSSDPAVTSVTLDKDTLSLTVGGETATLTANVAANYDTIKTVGWSSSDTSVATVNNGVVTPVAAGTATISATSTWDSTKSADCTVTVTATDISTATVNLAADNSVESIKVGDDTITDLSGFDITYGTDESHTATAVPTEAGTYYAYVTPKDTNTAYTGTAKSAAFTVASTDPTYTITIPAEVDLKSTAPVNITAEDVTLGEGQKIIVTLDSASNTDSGSEFSAKTENGKSEVKYKINDGAIGLDDSNKTVAEFTGNGERELNFAVTDESGIKYAGAHTETLTFTVSVETSKAAAEKPDIAQADCTFSPSNGKSTLSNANITTAMEYSADNGTTWTDVTSAGSIASLAAGTVQIRVKETADKLASEAVSITVPEVLHINELVGPYTGDRLTCEYYAGETWQALVNRYDLIKVYSNHPAFGSDGFIYYEGSFILVTDLVDNTKTYEVQ